jgi:hypothetical protein
LRLRGLPPGKHEQLFELANIVAQARRTYARSADIPEAGEENEDKNTVDVTIPLKAWVHQRIKTLAQDYRDEEGRKIPMYRYIQTILERHVQIVISRPGMVTDAEWAGHPSVVKQEEADFRPTRLVDEKGRINVDRETGSREH